MTAALVTHTPAVAMTATVAIVAAMAVAVMAVTVTVTMAMTLPVPPDGMIDPSCQRSARLPAHEPVLVVPGVPDLEVDTRVEEDEPDQG